MQPVYGAICGVDEVGTVEARATTRHREDGLRRNWLLERFIFKPPRADLPRESEIKRIYYLHIALPSAKGLSVRLERVAHRHVSLDT
jgi:hypothetical protein